MANTLFFYDLETFGRNPAWDKVAQFAGIRTDENFNIVGEPLVLYCKITPDYLPDPEACFITGITPQETLEKGLTEYDFIKRIDKEFSTPGTCVVGYNSINFDDEFIRNLYYRNFRDPYLREWNRGNSRWDILNLTRALHDFRPEGVNWLKNSEGKPLFKLEDLSKANGIEHVNAHDALSDVEATIGLAKKIFQEQPKFFRFYFTLRRKDAVKKYIDVYNKTPFYHTSSMLTSDKGCTTMMVPLAVDPNNKNSIICYDLKYDPTEMLKLSSKEIKDNLFSPGAKRIHLKCVHINKSPFVAPLGTLDENRSVDLGINNKECFKNLDIIKSSETITQKVIQVYEKDNNIKDINDPDFQIYTGGFFKDEDRAKFTLIHNTREEDLVNLNLNFEDPRIPEMLWRMICRNYPEVLNQKDLEKWRNFCATRNLYPPTEEGMDISTFEDKLNTYINSKELSAGKKEISKKLLEYVSVLKRKILSES